MFEYVEYSHIETVLSRVNRTLSSVTLDANNSTASPLPLQNLLAALPARLAAAAA